MRRQLFCIILMTIAVYTQAQSAWSLERCITHAIENNLNVKQSEVNVGFADITKKQAKHARYPSLNLTGSLNSNFGRSLDPITDAFTTQNFISNGFNLNTGMTIFNGFRISNTIKQSDIDRNAVGQDLEQTKRDISLSVANTYLSALFADENLAIAQSQLETSQEQLAQVETLITAGIRPRNESLDIEAQIANNEQQVITAENSKVIALLSLKQQLMLEPEVEMTLIAPSNVTIESDPDLLTFSEVYMSALSTQPNVKAGDLRIESARMGEKIAKAGLLPSLSIGGSVGSNYSNQGRKLAGTTSEIVEQTVFFNGTAATIGTEQLIPSFVDNPYIDQIDENLSYGIGLSVNYPIYNNYATRANIERSKLSTINAATQGELIRNQLRTTVQQALVDAKAAKRRLNAASRSVQAQAASFANAEKRFEAGTINTFEYVTQKNALAQAEFNAVIAKYEYLFALKIIDFYMGKQIKL